jgi:hypothetical protein
MSDEGGCLMSFVYQSIFGDAEEISLQGTL